MIKRALYILFSLLVSAAAFANCNSATSVSLGTATSAFTKYNVGTGAGRTGQKDCGWVDRGYKEVWLKTVMPASGRLVIETEGHYLDGYMAVYTGSCSNLDYHICSNNGRVPEVLDINDIDPGETVYIRIAMTYDNKIGVRLYSLGNVDRPACSDATQAANLCANATLIQSPNGYCGNTSDKYTPERPGNLQNEFCGSIENNSWLKFVAAASEAELNVFVRNCQYGIGVQMRVYETKDCKTFIPYSNCWNPAIETNGVVKASGLTPGHEYLLMIDGYAGDVCEYTIQAGRGIETPQAFIDDIICEGRRYQKNGFDVDQPGTYRRQLIGPRGNDSLVILTLTEEKLKETNLNGHIYSCERYQKNGFDVNTPGKHYLNLRSKVGCDSIVVLNLEVEPRKEFEIDAAICEGAYYAANGFYENKAGTYTRTEKSKQGCDSLITLHLSVKDGLDLAVHGDAEICAGETTTITASGGVQYTWKDSNGHKIGEGETINLAPQTTTTYRLFSKTVEACPSTVTDCQGNVYPVAQIGQQCWMAANLKVTRYDTESERPNAYIYKMTATSENAPTYFDPRNATSDYDDNLTSSIRGQFGYLYTWAAVVGFSTANEALNQRTQFAGDRQGICPNGWHVPKRSEMNQLFASAGGIDNAGRKLRSVNGWYKKTGSGAIPGTDEFGFTLLPTSFATDNVSYYVGGNGSIWTCDPDTQDKNMAWDIYSFYNMEGFDYTNNEKYYARAVRCVRRLGD